MSTLQFLSDSDFITPPQPFVVNPSAIYTSIPLNTIYKVLPGTLASGTLQIQSAAGGAYQTVILTNYETGSDMFPIDWNQSTPYTWVGGGVQPTPICEFANTSFRYNNPEGISYTQEPGQTGDRPMYPTSDRLREYSNGGILVYDNNMANGGQATITNIPSTASFYFYFTNTGLGGFSYRTPASLPTPLPTNPLQDNPNFITVVTNNVLPLLNLTSTTQALCSYWGVPQSTTLTVNVSIINPLAQVFSSLVTNLQVIIGTLNSQVAFLQTTIPANLTSQISTLTSITTVDQATIATDATVIAADANPLNLTKLLSDEAQLSTAITTLVPITIQQTALTNLLSVYNSNLTSTNPGSIGSFITVASNITVLLEQLAAFGIQNYSTISATVDTSLLNSTENLAAVSTESALTTAITTAFTPATTGTLNTAAIVTYSETL